MGLPDGNPHSKNNPSSVLFEGIFFDLAALIFIGRDFVLWRR